MTYGLPYQGSKSKIAPWIIEQLPKADCLVDLMAGGCAVTHAAMVSGKYKRFIANDIEGIPEIFKNAINGKYKDFSTVPTREEFYSTDDKLIKLLYSFGNGRKSYLWSPDNERIKVIASKMLLSKSLHDRRRYYLQFIRTLQKYTNGVGRIELHNLEGLQNLQGLERLQRLQDLERLQRLQDLERIPRLQNLETYTLDYRDVKIPKNAIVYCDPPYRSTKNSKRYTTNAFDYHEFDKWLNNVDFPVYVSEYDAPDGCVEIAEIERLSTMAAKANVKRTEKLFVQERFLNEYKKETEG